MLLSINIPTYNRGRFLKKNLEILAQQITECNACNAVEINISNNSSIDDTDAIVKEFMAIHNDLKVGYNHFDDNYGPDKNFITTMQMAHGDYTILLGDDDFLVKDGLKTIWRLIKDHPEVDIFLSNRTEIDEDGNFLRESWFLDEAVQSRVFDFSDDNHAGLFFSLCKSVGGCLTFISSIIYKTSILCEIGDYDGSLDGTYYSFWYYLWGKLSRGGKLFYYNKSFILNTQVFNTNFGNGLKRSLVEFEGFQALTNLFFKDKCYKYTILEIPKRCKPMYMLIQECILDKETYYQRLIPVLKQGNSEEYSRDLEVLLSPRFQCSCLANTFMPKWIMKLFHSLR